MTDEQRYQEWLKNAPSRVTPLEEYDLLRQRQNMLLPALPAEHQYECFCNLKKYGITVFDPGKMPLTWRGCGSCGKGG